MKKLYRSTTNKMLAGVCGGLAEYFDIDPTLVRIVYVLVSVLSAAFPGMLVYLVFWAVVPKRPAIEQPGGREDMPDAHTR